MKIVSTIARYLLGLMFVVFGSNMFLQFMKGQMPPGWPGSSRPSCLPHTTFMWWARSW